MIWPYWKQVTNLWPQKGMLTVIILLTSCSHKRLYNGIQAKKTAAACQHYRAWKQHQANRAGGVNHRWWGKERHSNSEACKWSDGCQTREHCLWQCAWLHHKPLKLMRESLHTPLAFFQSRCSLSTAFNTSRERRSADS